MGNDTRAKHGAGVSVLGLILQHAHASNHRSRARLLVGHFLCFAGFGVWAVSVPLHLLRVGSATDLAVYSGVLSMASALGIPLLSPLVDRGRRRTVILAAALALVIGALLRWGASAIGLLSLPLLLVVDAFNALAFGTLQPALQAVVATLCGPADTGMAMGRQRLAEGLSRMVAPACGGALFAAWGGDMAFLAVAVLFGSAVAVFASTRCDESPPERPRTLASWWSDVAAGVRVKLRIPEELSQTIASVAVGAATAPLMGVAMPQLLHGAYAPAALGYAQAAFGLGGVAGYWLVRPRLSSRFNDRQVVVATLTLASLGCCFMQAWLPIVLALCVLIGAAMACYLVAMQANRMLATPQWYRGRLAALNIVLAQVGTVIGAATLAGAQQAWGARGPFLVSAVLLAATAFWILVDRSRFGVLAATPEVADGLYGRSHPSLFAQVPRSN